MDYVLAHKQPARRYDEEVSNEDNNRGSYAPVFGARREPVAASPVASKSSDEDDALTYFQQLADE